MLKLNSEAFYYLVYMPLRGIVVGAGCGLCVYLVFLLLPLIPGFEKELDLGEGGRRLGAIGFIFIGFCMGITQSFLYLKDQWKRKESKHSQSG